VSFAEEPPEIQADKEEHEMDRAARALSRGASASISGIGIFELHPAADKEGANEEFAILAVSHGNVERRQSDNENMPNMSATTRRCRCSIGGDTKHERRGCGPMPWGDESFSDRPPISGPQFRAPAGYRGRSVSPHRLPRHPAGDPGDPAVQLRDSCSLTWKILLPHDENVCEPEASMKPRVRRPTIEEGRGVIAADLI
jgi:hypothetical protein